MASISSLTGSSSATSIYGNRNVISGLASGLDTETLIENAVSGYKSKIQGLQQKQTQVQWKQDAYRSILDKMINMNRKYTSYTSDTNLSSQSFFNKAVKNSVLGKYADAVSASGRTNSNVQINGIKNLATSAKYTSNISDIGLLSAAAGQINGNTLTATGAESFDLMGKVDVGKLSGGMTITYGGSSVYLGFTEKDVYKSAEEMAEGIREKLDDALVRTGSGDYVKASDRIQVNVDKATGQISFSDKSNAKNSVYISSVDKAVKNQLYMSDPGTSTTGFRVSPSNLYTQKDMVDYLDDKSLSVTFNGTTKTVSLEGFKDKAKEAVDAKLKELEDALPEGGTLTDDEVSAAKAEVVKETYQKMVQEGLDKAFGAGKVKMELVDDKDTDGKVTGQKMEFTASKGDTLSVTSSASKALGLGENGLTSYLNTSAKLKDIFGDFGHLKKEDVDEKEIASSIDEIGKDGKKYVIDSEGYVTDKDGVRVEKTKKMTINGKEFEFSADTTLDSMINRINGDKDAGVNISYSKLTNQFSISATETGTSGKIEMKGELAQIFGATKAEGADDFELDTSGSNYTPGADAVFNVTVNGEEIEMTRSSNDVDFDGMTVTLKDTFGYDEAGNLTASAADAIKFSSEADADKIVEAIQSFVNDYNEMVTEIRTQYATQPAEKSSTNHTRYMPLTDEDKEGMSESAIAAYEEKAKQGILFGETELSSLHSALRNAITGISTDRNVSYTESAEFNQMLQDIGITTSYSGGLTTLSLDTDKLRQAISNDPDRVRDAFSQTKENGASTDGLMQRVQKVMNQYANTSSGSPGILVQRAGSQYAPLSINNNSLQDLYDSYTEQIEKIQSTMADRIDYYTSQFTALEQMMSQMNSQSSMLSGLMGGTGSY